VKKKNLKWHDWFGGQFWVGGWYYGSPSYVDFFTNVCGLKLTVDISERAEAYRKVCESVNYIWPNSNFVIVCARPAEINRDEQGWLHNEHGMSIRYPDGWGLYHLHGVRFPKDLYLRVISGEMSAADILKIEDIDQRMQAMKFANGGLRDFFKAEGGNILDTYDKRFRDKVVHYELWRVPKGETFTNDVHFMVYDCPTGLNRELPREYSKGVPPFNRVAEAMAWGVSSDEFTVSPEEWELMEPLVHEA